MRVSVEKCDPGYGRLTRRVRAVYLDCALVRGPITADDEAGYVKAHRYGDAGLPLVDFQKGEFVIDEMRGKVEIILDGQC